jgi:hypothetical protein
MSADVRSPARRSPETRSLPRQPAGPAGPQLGVLRNIRGRRTLFVAHHAAMEIMSGTHQHLVDFLASFAPAASPLSILNDEQDRPTYEVYLVDDSQGPSDT